MSDSARRHRRSARWSALASEKPTSQAISARLTSLSTQLALRDRADRQAAAAILLSPWLDLTESYPSSRENDSLDWGTRELVLGHASVYAGPIPLDDPRLSLIGAKLQGLAPLLVQVGEVERRRDEGVELCRRATAAGVEATLDVVPDMPHVPALFAAHAPEGARALERAAAFATQRLGGTTPDRPSG